MHIFRYLDTNGDGTGTEDAIGNYATPTDFYIKPPASEVYILHRMIVTVRDSVINADDYGGLLAALSNGITVAIKNDDGVVTDLTDGVPIKTNAHWGRLCYDSQLLTWGTGNEFLVVRWTFSRTGKPITLYGDNRNSSAGTEGARLAVTLNDDFSGIVEHRFMVQGYVG